MISSLLHFQQFFLFGFITLLAPIGEEPQQQFYTNKTSNLHLLSLINDTISFHFNNGYIHLYIPKHLANSFNAQMNSNYFLYTLPLIMGGFETSLSSSCLDAMELPNLFFSSLDGTASTLFVSLSFSSSFFFLSMCRCVFWK